MNIESFQKIINEAWENKSQVSKNSDKKLVEKHKIDPNLCVFVEDVARNLKPAYEMGMTTVWIENDEPWAAKFSDSNFINYKTKNLTEFLKKINLLKAA